MIISICVILNSVASGSSRVAIIEEMEWLCSTAPAPLSSYACRRGKQGICCLTRTRDKAQRTHLGTHRHKQRRTLAELGGFVGQRASLGLFHNVAFAIKQEHVGRLHALLLHSGWRHDDAVGRDL